MFKYIQWQEFPDNVAKVIHKKSWRCKAQEIASTNSQKSDWARVPRECPVKPMEFQAVAQ